MIGIEQGLLFFFMNPSVIGKNKVKYIHYFLMDSLNILMHYILITGQEKK